LGRFLGHSGFLLWGEPGGLSMSTTMMGAHLGHSAFPVPAHPPLHGAVMNPHYLSYLVRAPACSKQPQGVQARPHFALLLLPISFSQSLWRILGLPLYRYPFLAMLPIPSQHLSPHLWKHQIGISSLERVTYRGYDSFGVALLNGHGIAVSKSVGRWKNIGMKWPS